MLKSIRLVVRLALAFSITACGGGGAGMSGGTAAAPLPPTADTPVTSAAADAPIPSSAPDASLASNSPDPASAASVATATTSLATASVASYRGCPVFTTGDSYNKLATGASIDAHSASYINSMYAAGNRYGFYASTGVEKANLATNSTPLMVVHPTVSWHTLSTRYPWLSTYFIEPLADRHAVVVQTQSCHLYEAFGTSYSSGILRAYSGATWDMTKPFVPLPGGSPSAMASGLSLFAGAVKWEDYRSGAIRHALNWAGVAHTVAYNAYVRPASDTDHLAFYGSGMQLPYGAHLRLKSTVSTAGWGPQATMVANAMKTYGIYLSDTGNSGNALYFMNAPNGSNPWNRTDLSALSRLHITDFQVLTLPTIQHT